MDWNSYLQAEGGDIEYPDSDVPINAYSNPPKPLPANVVEPSISKYIGFMALIYFIGMLQMHLGGKQMPQSLFASLLSYIKKHVKDQHLS